MTKRKARENCWKSEKNKQIAENAVNTLKVRIETIETEIDKLKNAFIYKDYML